MKVAVCIPTLNASQEWPRFSSALKAQTIKPDQVIVIDSSSDDNTGDLVRNDGYRLVEIARRDFRHGATRQQGAELAPDADVLVYLTQDAVLAQPDSMANLLAAFKDPTIGAAYGRQLPRTGAGPIESHARIFNYPPVSAVRSIESVPTLGFRSIFFSNSFGAYRNAALQQVGGFPPAVNFGEDTVVAARMLKLNWKIAYVAEAPVYHSHGYRFREEYKRYVAVGELHKQEGWLLDEFGGASGAGAEFVKSEIRFLARRAPWLIPESMIRVGVKYAGYKRGRS